MAKLDMDGPFDLSPKVIDEKVGENLIGNYALGYMNKGDKFVVKAIGRADTDLRSELKTARGKFSGGFLSTLFSSDTPDKFKFSIASTADSAYQVECRVFESFGGTAKLLNKQEPVPPKA